MYEGPNFGEWGPVCTLTTVSDFATTMEDQFDAGVYNLCDVVRANAVGGASQYRWEFTNDVTGDTYTAIRPSRSLKLETVSPTLDMNASYSVDVFATVNTFENGISLTKNLATTSVPQTELLNFFFSCGDVINFGQWTFAQNVCGADSYTFRFTNLDSPQAPFTVVRPSRFIVFNQADIIPNDTYEIDVFATIVGQDGTYTGTYGPTCQLTFNAPANKGIVADPNFNINNPEAALSIYPNPVQNGNEVTVVVKNIKSESENIQIEIFDLSGKLVYARNVAGVGNVISRVQLDDKISQGVYLVQTRIDGVLIETKKLFVQ